MQDVQTTITGLAPRQTQYGQATDVYLDGGQKAGLGPKQSHLAQKAQTLIGQAGVTVRLKPNGKFLNIEDIAAPGEQLPPLAAIQTPTQNGASRPQGNDAARQDSIVRQNVLRTAFDFVGATNEGQGYEALVVKAFVLAQELYDAINSTGPVKGARGVTPEGIATAVSEQTQVPVMAGSQMTGPEWSTT